jgi:hypothetical protein
MAKLALIHGICIRTGRVVVCAHVLSSQRVCYVAERGSPGGVQAGTDTRHLHSHR